MSAYTMCEECGFTYDDKEKSGKYFCPQCQEEKQFYSFTFGCGGKPTELYEKLNE